MALTNVLDLPEPLVRAVERQRALYDKKGADYSVTELISPPQQAALVRRHGADLVEDVADNIYGLMGSIMAEILAREAPDALANACADLVYLMERRGFAADVRVVVEAALRQCGVWSTPAPEPGQRIVLTERRFETEIGGKRISGRMDRGVLEPTGGGWVLDDWKMGSRYEAEGPKPEREQQLNAYAELLRRNGLGPIVRLRNVFVFRDWSKNQARLDPSYPQFQTAKIEAPLWSSDDATAFLERRVALHEAARKATDAELPACTMEEKWQDPDWWVVRKPANKKASRRLPTEALAREWLAEQDAKKFKGAVIELRASEPKRCILYCSVSEKCAQYAAERALRANGHEAEEGEAE